MRTGLVALLCCLGILTLNLAGCGGQSAPDVKQPQTGAAKAEPPAATAEKAEESPKPAAPAGAAAAGPGKPASGSTQPARPRPNSVAPAKEWETLWDASVSLDKVVLVGLEAGSSLEKGQQFTVLDKDNQFVFPHVRIITAGHRRIRVYAPGATWVRVYWARPMHLTDNQYPFPKRRMVDAKPSADGYAVLEVGEHPEWKGTVEKLRIDLFGKPGETIYFNKVELDFDKNMRGQRGYYQGD